MTSATHPRWLQAAQEKPEQRFWYEPAIESGLAPDWLIRAAIRSLLKHRLRQEDRGTIAANQEHLLNFVNAMRRSPIAFRVDSANAQHYEVPAAFFEKVLGPRMKYSCAWYDSDSTSLAEAENAMLQITSERAQLANGQQVLELGCGWGSLTLWMAERFPHSRITGVSNSASQREFILRRAADLGLTNVHILTADMNDFSAPRPYDRVVSVEMFEHMRNWEALLAKVATWLMQHGKLFVHIFTHRSFAYPFEVQHQGDWMARHFFTGGMMPSQDLLRNFDRDLKIEAQWSISGTHYQKTAEAWLHNMDAARKELQPLLAQIYGPGQARRWWVRWRIFFMACAELWGYRDGKEWSVSHYRLSKA